MRKNVSPGEAALRAYAEDVKTDQTGRASTWSKGFTRRRLMAGAGFVGVAALGSQLVSTRVSFGDPESTTSTHQTPM